jgi:hypothetical protein
MVHGQAAGSWPHASHAIKSIEIGVSYFGARYYQSKHKGCGHDRVGKACCLVQDPAGKHGTAG